MVKKIIIAALILIAAAATGALLFMPGPDLSGYRRLKNPAVRVMESGNVLVVEAAGSPEESGKKAFGLLFKTYFRLKGVPKGPGMPAPRARWPIAADTPKSQWRGLYAIPVPAGLPVTLPTTTEPGLSMRLETWDYGEVAEILHTGPYESETPDIERLLAFIKSGGYEVVGDHEEEYLRGPGMFFRGDPAKYLTIIRYRVKKAP